MCSVELPFSLIIENAMRRSHVRSYGQRVNPRPGPSEAARPVRRALFAEPVDHEETARVLAREFSELQADAKNRWNYDFESDRPLEGRFEWEALATAPRSADAQPASADQRPAEPPKAQRPAEAPKAQRPQRPTTQRKLTDFMSKRKRSSSSLQAPVPVKSSKTATSVAASSPAT